MNLFFYVGFQVSEDNIPIEELKGDYVILFFIAYGLDDVLRVGYLPETRFQLQCCPLERYFFNNVGCIPFQELSSFLIG